MSSASAFQEVFATARVSNPYSAAVFDKIASCHTAKLGYHSYQCSEDSCKQQQTLYHSCGNRHCPFCGSLKTMDWINDRRTELLPTAYYHVVFTLPHEWNGLILAHRAPMFKMLFEAASQTLLAFGSNPKYLGAVPGITTVLHTWGQDLSFHPHLHCIVSGGGMHSTTGKWVAAKRANSTFLFPITGLRKVFKAKFLTLVRKLKLDTKINIPKLITDTGKLTWNVYAKAPFGSADAVVEYLGRYTHKIAITKHRILEVSDTTVRFRYKDYQDESKVKEMTLSKEEFVRRFEMHILPRHFVKIRHYGYLQNHGKYARLQVLRESLGLSEFRPKVAIPLEMNALLHFGINITICPCCKKGKMLLVRSVYPRNKGQPMP